MKKGLLILTGIIVLAFICTLIHGQVKVDVKDKVNDQVNDRANQRTDEGIDKGLDALENGIKKAFTKKDKESEEESNTQEEENSEIESDDNADNPESKSVNKQEQPAQSLVSYTKYDFVPGDKVLLFEDFSQDAVGDFPALWTTNGSGEVKTINLYPGNWLHMLASDMTYQLQKPVNLPDNFIFEFDVVPTRQPETEDASFSFSLFASDNDNLNDENYPGIGGINIMCLEGAWEVEGYDEGGNIIGNGSTKIAPVENEKLNHIIVWIQKRRLRIYHSGQKAVDLPTILSPGQKLNHLRFTLWSCSGFPYVTNLRFTSAAPDTRNKLLTEGKIVSYGIYFDVNSDKVKPESYGALNEIANVLKENPSVKIKIIGHTDSDGDDAKNLELSKRRGASVKNELVKTFGIDSSRMETDGKGESQPIAANDSPDNKAKNRRVEFIKL